MDKVVDYLEAIEITIKNSDLVNGKFPNSLVNINVSIYKYSLLYLIKTEKIKFTDHEDSFKKYMKAYTLKQHLLVANAYLESQNKPLLVKEEMYVTS